MSLFQITEPQTGSKANPAKRYGIGIDLGTTHSLVAIVKNKKPVCLADEHDLTLLPSVVHYLPDGSYKVGQEALAKQIKDPNNTISSVKRVMGKTLGDLAKDSVLPYHCLNENGLLKIATKMGTKSPTEVSAAILKHLRIRAEKALPNPIFGAVITVPAYFDEAQRQATKDAATLAHIRVLRLLNEPTAAAIAYGLDKKQEGTFLVYDLGGGTFDVSILRLSKGLFEVVATCGDALLGGDDFDQRIYCWLLEKTKVSKLPNEDVAYLLAKAKKAKEKLSKQKSAKITATLSIGKAINITLNLKTFEAITKTLVDKTLHIVQETLQEAHLRINDIQSVIMVGGATYMPCIRSAIETICQKPPLAYIDPERVVALGAALQANALVGNQTKKWLLLDVIPLSLGIETMGGIVEKIIPRNSVIPIAQSQEFTTYQDGQNAMAIHVVQGERELVKDCRSLARFTLSNIPPTKAGFARVQVTFQVDADGLLSVSACELSTHKEVKIEVKPTYGLSEKDIQHLLKESIAHQKEDQQAKELAESIVEAQTLLRHTQKAMNEDGALLNDLQRGQILEAIHTLEKLLLQPTCRAPLQEAQLALSQATEDFAKIRMDQAIQVALRGKKIDTLKELK